jgi:hypothetical protein
MIKKLKTKQNREITPTFTYLVVEDGYDVADGVCNEVDEDGVAEVEDEVVNEVVDKVVCGTQNKLLNHISFSPLLQEYPLQQ